MALWARRLVPRGGPVLLAAALTAVCSILLLSTGAGATTLSFGLDIEFSGATPPEGATPWLTLTFDDSFGGPNTVRMTMSTGNLVGDETVTQWHFNFDPSLDPMQITFTPVENSDSVPSAINTGVDLFMANGDGFFDIQFEFPPPPGPFGGRFTSGESVIYDLTYISPITVASFDLFSELSGGQGSFKSAAHVQSIGAGADSGWIGHVPEPSTALLLASGLIGLAAHARRRSV